MMEGTPLEKLLMFTALKVSHLYENKIPVFPYRIFKKEEGALSHKYSKSQQF